ncbi:hypothetical protein K474DRAFT_1666234 [Panus rudis PR-1116 ss-1]|nr:hypothetical protein K474DRAFT_1666234 [Panus rudis PR-1116 ss-1]
MPPKLLLNTFVDPDDPTALPPLKRVSQKTFNPIKPRTSRQYIEEHLVCSIVICLFASSTSY